MKPSNRILIPGILIEGGPFSLGAYLLMQLLPVMQFSHGRFRPSVSIAQSTSTITTTLGTAMGAIGGLLLAIFIILKRRGS